MRDHTSVNALVREYLIRYVDAYRRRLEAIDALDALAAGSSSSSIGAFSREELHLAARIGRSMRIFIDTNLWAYRLDKRRILRG